MTLLGWLGLFCALVSAACIALLAVADPKRRGASARPGLRRLLVFAALTPGFVLGFAGRWSDFLIWIGAAAILGWAIAAVANMQRKPRS